MATADQVERLQRELEASVVAVATLNRKYDALTKAAAEMLLDHDAGMALAPAAAMLRSALGELWKEGRTDA